MLTLSGICNVGSLGSRPLAGSMSPVVSLVPRCPLLFPASSKVPCSPPAPAQPPPSCPKWKELAPTCLSPEPLREISALLGFESLKPSHQPRPLLRTSRNFLALAKRCRTLKVACSSGMCHLKTQRATLRFWTPLSPKGVWQNTFKSSVSGAHGEGPILRNQTRHTPQDPTGHLSGVVSHPCVRLLSLAVTD